MYGKGNEQPGKLTTAYPAYRLSREKVYKVKSLQDAAEVILYGHSLRMKLFY